MSKAPNTFHPSLVPERNGHMPKYSLGLDYGTLSARALLLDIESGEEMATAVEDYPHGVMDETLPNGKPLKPDWALQHPQDYLDVLESAVRRVLLEARANPADVVGIGVDCTASTVLPCLRDGTPLCFLPEYRSEPHAYAKLWKHHAAQPQATRLNAVAKARGEEFLRYYGGIVSSEWAIPKLWQVLEEAPELYNRTEKWIEAADWLVWKLCGKETRNACCAGYKALWVKALGYPPNEFFKALDPRLEHVIDDKMSRGVLPLGARAGGLTPAMAQALGLLPGTAVAAGLIDAHAALPAAGITGAGEMLAIMGTSTCHMLLGVEEVPVPGICGVAADGILPGYYAYEAGQCCVGDHFAWFIENCLPKAYFDQAAAKRVNIHELLREKAGAKRPGGGGLVALDWWNGNRSVLVDAELSGLLLGMTLQTRPEDIYRALIEATAYGTRKIVENFREYGLRADSFVAAGGIAQKDPMTMQIYADVLRMPVKVAGSAQAGARGAAIYGACAAGGARGGFDDVSDAARRLWRVLDTVYTPSGADAAIYDGLYEEYIRLHDYFGRGGNDVMKRLKRGGGG
jgi:L-ribulokinase